MFTIMENRKRPRLEVINKNSNNSNENMQGVASTTTAMATATYATIGGQSFILSNTNSPLPANILLSICDDNSNDSDEYILDHSILSPSKQEHTVATQTTNNLTQLQQTTMLNTMPQYRIINQAGKPLNTMSLNSSSMTNNTTVNANNPLISNSVHLPPGCEIYVIKEVFDLPKQVIAESNNTITTTSATTTSPKLEPANGTTIKLEPISSLPQQRHSTLKGNNTQIRNSNSTITINTNSPVTSTSNISSNSSDDTAKRSLILEAYKKRDDKRRAIHNEVERRRRDKINSWIFKLKEMLPSEVTACNNSSSTAATSSTFNQNTSSSRLMVQGSAASNTRTPSNDSKSQILIKACEYIKSMQEEINSLRECLTENENLRLKNQRLQNEINNLRTKQQQHQHKLHNNNNSILLTTNTTNNSHNHSSDDNSDNCEITLNSLNATYANVQLFAPTTTNQHHLADLVGLTTTNSNAATSIRNSANVIYNKRELIITDYVD